MFVIDDYNWGPFCLWQKFSVEKITKENDEVSKYSEYSEVNQYSER